MNAKKEIISKSKEILATADLLECAVTSEIEPKLSSICIHSARIFELTEEIIKELQS